VSVALCAKPRQKNTGKLMSHRWCHCVIPAANEAERWLVHKFLSATTTLLCWSGYVFKGHKFMNDLGAIPLARIPSVCAMHCAQGSASERGRARCRTFRGRSHATDSLGMDLQQPISRAGCCNPGTTRPTCRGARSRKWAHHGPTRTMHCHPSARKFPVRRTQTASCSA